eukprot:6880812-Prymnesium_polylepis.1
MESVIRFFAIFGRSHFSRLPRSRALSVPVRMRRAPVPRQAWAPRTDRARGDTIGEANGNPKSYMTQNAQQAAEAGRKFIYHFLGLLRL